MQNTEPDPRTQGKHPKPGCLLWITAAVLACFLLICAAFACLVILDPGTGDEGEKYNLSRRLERYKVAGQFIWYDFKDAVSRKLSSGAQSVSCPVAPPGPESELESELKTELESEPESEPESGREQ